MKHLVKAIPLFALTAVCFAAKAQQKQSLKDLLYSGKLKSDAGTVVHKDDDLTAKIDTGTRKPAMQEQPKAVAVAEPANATSNDAAKKVTATTTDVATNTNTTTTDDAANPAPVAAPAAPAPKSNTKIWKEFTDALISGLKSEVLTNKKIKKDDYYVIVEYELETDGKVNVLSVTSTPENALLQSEIKNRLDNAPPQLSPSLDSTGKPKKIKRKQSFTVSKE